MPTPAEPPWGRSPAPPCGRNELNDRPRGARVHPPYRAATSTNHDRSQAAAGATTDPGVAIRQWAEPCYLVGARARLDHHHGHHRVQRHAGLPASHCRRRRPAAPGRLLRRVDRHLGAVHRHVGVDVDLRVRPPRLPRVAGVHDLHRRRCRGHRLVRGDRHVQLARRFQGVGPGPPNRRQPPRRHRHRLGRRRHVGDRVEQRARRHGRARLGRGADAVCRHLHGRQLHHRPGIRPGRLHQHLSIDRNRDHHRHRGPPGRHRQR